MSPLKVMGRRWPTALLLALAAIAIGAVFGAAQTGNARIAVKPSNTTPPAISGSPQVGSTLVAADGSWSGTTPFSFSYDWARCDANGQKCVVIPGDSTNSYVVQQADVGSSIVAGVTATNSDGSARQPSLPTALVTAPVATGCPAGTGTIQIADLSPPARLQIDQQAITPGVVTPATVSLQAHFRVTACGGRPVQGALLYATAVPFNQFTVPPEATTGSDGTADLNMTQRSGFPAARKQQLLVMFVRARKSGDPLEAGVSGRVLVSFPVNLNG